MSRQDGEDTFSQETKQETGTRRRVSVNLASHDVTAPLELRDLSRDDVEALYREAAHAVMPLLSLADAENVASKAVTQFIEYGHRHEIKYPRALLRTIAKRLASKVQNRLQEVSIEEAIFDNKLSENSSFENYVFNKDIVRDVAHSIWQLPPKTREIILGRIINGESYSDIAKRLNMNEGAVRVSYHRALARLRENPTLAAWREEEPT